MALGRQKSTGKSRQAKAVTASRSRSVLEMSHSEARRFFLKPQSYCSVDLPPYINFDSVLKDVAQHLSQNPLIGQQASSPREEDNVNHLILNNKDGKYAWRPLQLCHPA